MNRRTLAAAAAVAAGITLATGQAASARPMPEPDPMSSPAVPTPSPQPWTPWAITVPTEAAPIPASGILLGAGGAAAPAVRTPVAAATRPAPSRRVAGIRRARRPVLPLVHVVHVRTAPTAATQPVTARPEAATEAPAAPRTHQHPTRAHSTARTWHVRAGETLSGIAFACGVSTRALAEANGIENWNRIYADTTLRIPQGGE